jgi:hypothetical protein
MKNNLFELFVQATSDELLQDIQRKVNQEGYYGFRQIAEGISDKIKAAVDEEMPAIEKLIERGKQLFPTPVNFSPAWERIWPELEKMAATKIHLMHSIPADTRDGEWQVIIDNPFAVQEVVCYPALNFLDAVYLYAYFRPDLEKNEYLRLQKIQTLVMDFGS